MHVNGIIETAETYEMNYDNFEWKSYVSSTLFEDIKKNTNNIFMINENANDEIVTTREKAKAYLSNSRKIFSIGFAFDLNNVNNIGLNNLNSLQQDLFALIYNDDISVKNRVLTVCNNKNSVDGTQSVPLGCSAAAALGFFDQ